MKHLLAIVLLLSGFIWLARPEISAAPYSYDEADYMYAASRGFAANYLDSPAQSFAEFLRTGLRRGRDAQQKTALSQMIRDSGDIDFYRHWHGPLYFYWLTLLRPWSSNEHTVRALCLLFPALAILTIYFGFGWAFHRNGFLAAALYGWSVVTTVSSELAPHELFVLTILAGLFFLARFIETERRGYWYAAVVLSAMAVATLEVGLILVLTLAAVSFFYRAKLALDWPFVWRSLLLLAASVFVVWPGAFLKLAVVKAYLFMVYLAVVRKAAWGATFTQAWSARSSFAPVEWLLLIVAGALLIRDRERRDARVLPFLLFALLMLLFMIKVNADGPRYMLPFLPVFDVFSAAVIMEWLSRQRIRVQTNVAAALCIALVLNTLRVEAERSHNTVPTRQTELLSEIRERHLDDKTLLVPHGDFPMLHYYFPRARFVAYGQDASGLPAGVAADAVVGQGDPPSITTY